MRSRFLRKNLVLIVAVLFMFSGITYAALTDYPALKEPAAVVHAAADIEDSMQAGEAGEAGKKWDLSGIIRRLGNVLSEDGNREISQHPGSKLASAGQREKILQHLDKKGSRMSELSKFGFDRQKGYYEFFKRHDLLKEARKKLLEALGLNPDDWNIKRVAEALGTSDNSLRNLTRDLHLRSWINRRTEISGCLDLENGDLTETRDFADVPAEQSTYSFFEEYMLLKELRIVVRQALVDSNWRPAVAARALNTTPEDVQGLIKNLGLRRPRTRRSAGQPALAKAASTGKPRLEKNIAGALSPSIQVAARRHRLNKDERELLMEVGIEILYRKQTIRDAMRWKRYERLLTAFEKDPVGAAEAFLPILRKELFVAEVSLVHSTRWRIDQAPAGAPKSKNETRDGTEVARLKPQVDGIEAMLVRLGRKRANGALKSAVAGTLPVVRYAPIGVRRQRSVGLAVMIAA